VIRRLAFGAASILGFAAGALAEEESGGLRLPQLGVEKQIEARKSYTIPALEIIGFDLLLNQFNRRYFEGDDYDTSWSSIKENLQRGWVTDSDPYDINQLGHPYQGSMYHGFARSAGLGYWESAAYTFAGSIFWEIAGETTPPSRNDQINSGIGGSFLGEALFRMSSLMLERGGGVPKFWRELGAAVVSPPTGFNRLAFGERFDPVFSSRSAPYYSRFGLALSGTTQNEQGNSTSAHLSRDEVLADFSIDYGLPGNPDYAYRRPFDYFAFQITASSVNVVENVLTRGLLVGDDYRLGPRYRGVWGLYGGYDYIAPQTYRVSSTALSLGTTAEWRLSEIVSLQGTLLGGVGYAAVGTVNATTDSEYHYGLAPQALLALRMIFGDRVSFDITGREYFVSKVAAADTGGHDNIIRFDAALTLRLYRQQAVAVRYLHNRRDASFPGGDITQTRATLGLFYVLLGHDRFGVFNWR
jgi:hypothetical protein